MADANVPTYTLNDGTTLPAIGFGTYPLKGGDGTAAIVSALEVGYRLLDTAVNYENEKEVGEAIRRSGVDRGELRVASKLPGRHHAYNDAVSSVHGSLERLGLDYLDLHLIHWPNPSVGRYPDAWRALRLRLMPKNFMAAGVCSAIASPHLWTSVWSPQRLV